MFEHNINPVFLNLGPVKIYYYGLVYALSFLFIYMFLKHQSKNNKIKLKSDDVDNLLIYITIGMIIGARSVYYLVYNFPVFLENPLNFFMLWKGGMSFHGSFIGITLAAILFSKKYKYKFYEIADTLVIPFTIALFFGRIANFVNGELYGRITDLPWAVKFPRAEGFRHPSQLYEALKNLFMFSVLFSIKDNKKLPHGIRFWLFVAMYGILRFLIEFVRQPDAQIGANGFFFGWITMGQILCIPMFLAGLYFIVKIYKKEMKKYD
jgi:phosphatidylglycerol:prolipoprotein diacylglycerol transferase